MVAYRKAEISDMKTLTYLAQMLYRDRTQDELYAENREAINSFSQIVILVSDFDKDIGFAHCALRNEYVEGTKGGRVGYLEGIYVLPEYRLKGIGSELVSRCEDWAKDKACREFASDCEIENMGSCKFHLKTGFKEANKIVCFTKRI